MSILFNSWRFLYHKTFSCNILLFALFLLVIVVSAVLTVLTFHLNRYNDYQLNTAHQSNSELQFQENYNPRQLVTTTSVASTNRSHRIYKYNVGNALRPPYIPFKKREPGWRVIKGNVVVHEGHVDNPHNISYLVNSAEACLGSLNVSLLSIVIFVESNAANLERRRAIRETWALPMLQRTQNVKVIFMLGASQSNDTQNEIEREFYMYGDVVQETFKENFKHLTLKTVMGLKWTQTYCNSADYVVKTDDDILIHIPNLVKLLQTLGKDAKRRLLCHKNHSRRIERISKVYAKYQVSTFELPGSFFPEYCSGFTYIMSRDTASELYAAAISTPYFFIEDVFVTGFCRHKAGIQLLNDEHIALKPYISFESAPCDFKDGRVTSQELTIEETRSIWTGLNTRGFFCPVLVNEVSFIKRLKKRLKSANRNRE